MGTKTVVVKSKIVGEGRTRVVRLRRGSTAIDLLKKLGINRETAVIRINGRISPEEERLKSGDTVEIMRVVTGG
ncbi:MAG: MoaD/ThiS family protein [Candidatus Hadarchaeales archaeon]